MIIATSKTIRLEAKNALLLLSLNGDDVPRVAYFGSKEKEKAFSFHKDSSPTVFSCFGSLNYQNCSFGYIDEKGNFAHRFLLKSVETKKVKISLPRLPSCKGEREVLELTYLDLEDKAEVVQFLSLYEEHDTFVSSFAFRNRSKETLFIDRAFSLQLELPGKGYDVISFHGDWGRERKINSTTLRQGELVLSTTCGISSAHVNPFFLLRKNKRYYAFNLLYSGNHKESVSVSPLGSTRILTGVNDDYFSYSLKPGGIFYTPEAIFTCGDSINEVKTHLNSFVNQHILKRKKSPLVFNTWEAVSTKLEKKNWQELAVMASKIGCDTFVFDDGWYAHREDDKTSLGDFYLNKEKLGGDFDYIRSYLANLNLKLGLWIEPEMANPYSDLARSHPDFLLKTKGIQPLLKRNQYVLDMSNPKVVAYLKKTLSSLIEESGCSYIKWDFNRFVSDVCSGFASGYAFFYEFTLGYYDLISYLSERFPDVYFEGCSSGGARFDLGSLSYVSQIWTSDNTDPYDRLFNQESTGLCYPLSSISNHISESPNQQTGRKFPIKERTNVALFGDFGIEMDLRKAVDEELSYIQKAFAFYAKHRRVILDGKNLLLNSPFAKDLKGEICLLNDEAVCLLASLDNHSGHLCLAGLEEKTTYELKELGSDTPFRASGEELMSKGVFIEGKGKLNTAVYYLKAIPSA